MKETYTVPTDASFCISASMLDAGLSVIGSQWGESLQASVKLAVN